MGASILLTLAVTATIFITILTNLIKDIKTKLLQKKETPLIAIALTYLILTILLTLWTTNTLSFSPSDFLLIFAITLTIQTISITTILHKITQNKKTLYPLIPFALLIPLVAFSPKFLHIAIPISLFATLMSFLLAIPTYEKSTKYIILYSSLSLILYLITNIYPNTATLLVATSSLLFLLFITPFIKFLKLPLSTLIKKQKPESPLTHFLKHFIFIIIITNFIFIGTVSIHEFGHLLSSTKSNCEEAKIVYELKGLPHTEITCEDTSQKNIWTISGVALPFIIAILLFLSGGKFIKELSLQMTGFNLIISNLDIKSLGFSDSLATFTLILGIATSIFSLALLVKSRVE